MEQRRLGQPDWQLFSQDGGIFAVDRQAPQSYRTVRAPDTAAMRQRTVQTVAAGDRTEVLDPFTGATLRVIPHNARPVSDDPLTEAVQDYDLARKHLESIAQITPRAIDGITMTPQLQEAQARADRALQHIAALRAARGGQALSASGVAPAAPAVSLNGGWRASAAPMSSLPSNPYAALGALSDNSPRIWTGGVNNNGALNQPVASAPVAPSPTGAVPQFMDAAAAEAAGRAGQLQPGQIIVINGRRARWNPNR
jgi:hypothetical protein